MSSVSLILISCSFRFLGPPLHDHPGENEYRLQHTYAALYRIGGVPQVHSCLAQQGMKTVMVLAAERAGEPCNVIAPANMVRFDPLAALADHASGASARLRAHDGLTSVR